MPIDRGALDAQLREIGEGERWWEHREFRELPYVLHAEERIRGITIGRLLGRRRPRLGRAPRWLFVATDHRLVCLIHERFARKQVDIVWGQILRMHESNGMRSHKLTIATPERRYRLLIPKGDAVRFSAAISPLIPRPSIQRLHPDLEPLAWIPGFATVAAFPPFAGVISKVAMLSPPEYERHHLERLEATVDRLQSDVERLQNQVAFLEELLQARTEEEVLSRIPSET